MIEVHMLPLTNGTRDDVALIMTVVQMKELARTIQATLKNQKDDHAVKWIKIDGVVKKV
jgi:hypothetical protein